MNFELFFAKRLFLAKDAGDKTSRPAVRVASIAITLGLAVMLISIATVVGFKQEVRNIITGFSSHIQLTNYNNNNSYETHPIYSSDSLLQLIQKIPNVVHQQRFATKSAIIKTENDFQGIVLKGVGTDYDWDFFLNHLVEGQVLSLSDSITSNDVLISTLLAQRLKLKLGDSFITYFVQDPIRARKFRISGIFSTYFPDFDNLFILSDIRQIQRLNGWQMDQVSGLEIAVTDFDKLDAVWAPLYKLVANHPNQDGDYYYPHTITMLQPQILQWLDMLDTNVWIILILLWIVSGFAMISGLLILILEKIRMIGILKAMGATNLMIRKIFIDIAFFLISRAMVFGNLIGLGLCFIQQQTHLVKLDASTYFLAYVPIQFDWLLIILLNTVTLLLILILMLAPSYLITKVAPTTAIQYD